MSAQPPRPAPKSARAAMIAACCAIAAPVVIAAEGYIKVGYRDPIGIATACVGHTGPEVRIGQAYSSQQCDALLQSDLVKHAEAVNACIKVDTPLKSRAAFVSFGFNVGSNAFCTSTAARKLQAGDLAGACAELSRWTRAGGKVLPGLVRRRATERALCEDGLNGQ